MGSCSSFEEMQSSDSVFLLSASSGFVSLPLDWVSSMSKSISVLAILRKLLCSDCLRVRLYNFKHPIMKKSGGS